MGRPAAPQKDPVRCESQPQSTATRSARPGENGLDLRYSLMQVPDDPDEYVPTPKRKPEYAHVGSLDGSSDSLNRTKLPKPKSSRRNGSYVARAPPSSRRVSTRPVKPTRELRHHAGRASSKATRDKRRTVLDPLAEKSLARTLSQQNRLSYLATPPEMKSRPKPASPPSRNTSQRRSLTRFTKELERYCMAVSANGKAPLPLCTPTVSDSPTTLDTVSELLPYHRQFKAAGLAVTSREQMPKIPESIYQQLPVRENRSERHPLMSPVQIDGSTVTPSEEEWVSEDKAVPAIPRGDGGPSTAPKAVEPQLSAQQVKTVNRSLLPWARNKDAATASRTHTGRKFSTDHLHPSQAMAAQPVLTPSDKMGIIDAYFNSPAPNKPQDKQPEKQKTSLSSPSSSKESLIMDKPLPEQPSVERRPTLSKQPPMEQCPVPPRSGRRHMENTSQWPTARVLIHDNSPPPSDAKGVVEIREIPPTPIKSSDISGLSSPPTVEENEATIQRSISPPVELRKTTDTEENPPTPPKHGSGQQIPPTTDSRHHRSQSLSKQWSKVTVLRRRSKGRHLPLPTTIQEEPETSPEKKDLAMTSAQNKRNKKPSMTSQSQTQSQNTISGQAVLISEQTSGLVPQLPYTWKQNAVESSSSFEKALDAVIQKLDDMEERRQHERTLDLKAARKTSTEQESPEVASSKESNSKTETRPDPELKAPEKPLASRVEAASQTEDSVSYLDNDIADRDVLLGLKMAICAACDQDLDAWIREKTGLRLRRFLADLKAFDAVSKDGRPSASAPGPQPLHRQIRRNENEARRLKAERERRTQSMKKTLLPCFGADGSLAAPG